MKKSVRSQAAAAVAAVLATVSLAACSATAESSNDADSSGGSNSGDASGVAYAKAQLEKYSATQDHYGDIAAVPNVPDLNGKAVWYIPIGTSVPVLASMGDAISEALGNLGAKVHTCDGKFTPTTISECMSTAATQKAAAVITGFVDYNMVPAAFQDLASKGIPTLVGGQAAPSGVSASKTLGFFDASPLTQQAYKLMADAAIADSNGNAQVLEVSLTDSSTTKANTEATDAEFKQYCPACEVTTTETTTAAIAQLGSALAAKLSANPNIKYVIIPQDAFYQAALPGLQSAGFANKVKIITAGGSTAGMQSVKAGQIAYDMGQGVWNQGWSMADGAVRLLAGAEVQPETQGPIRVFTKDNAASLDLTDANYASSAWYGSDAWKQDYLTAWGAQK
ncbi:sugar ABC transporter substrate-binding protein [Nocardioides sp. Iso805N]|uniref:sugar ABC transporter substrate-binding protein n=1 Tax=Nocardioides sp. Iso805N TaxID=1283287 RepID=UPI00037C6AD8|nr:substrate-binding domain-containing protein [Nocardioides sp. Iso805N]